MTQHSLATKLTLISDYLAQRDLPDLTPETLAKAEITAFDLAILFGGAIPAAADTLGELWQQGLVKKIMLAGGIGHTTDHLRQAFGATDKEGVSEAELFKAYLVESYRIPEEALLLETRSTNCGENSQFALETLHASGYAAKNILIMQDASMQRRMGATFAKIWPSTYRLYHYAPYRPYFTSLAGVLRLSPDLWGLWEPTRYIELLLGEIPRLRDDPKGYGPLGKNFIEHVEIPQSVLQAFEEVSRLFPEQVRQPYNG